MKRVVIHPEVADALRRGLPVVALESAVVTSGMPRAPIEGLEVDVSGWRRDRPVNLEVALMMDRAVREAGATPAMIAVIDGALRIGLDATDIERLALDERAGKASISNFAACCAAGETAGTTVSATLAACSIVGRVTGTAPGDSHSAPGDLHSAPGDSPGAKWGIRVFATGGIGGVHRRGQSAIGNRQSAKDQQPMADGRWPTAPLDISADLLQLARTPTLVVSAGAKSILDLPATLEALETLGVPVLGYQTNQFPQFYCAGTADLPVPIRVESIMDVVTTCRMHWDLRPDGGLLLANPVPKGSALDVAEVEKLVEHAEQRAVEKGIAGAARTPFLLDEIARKSGGRTLRANIALLQANARLAAQVAADMTS